MGAKFECQIHPQSLLESVSAGLIFAAIFVSDLGVFSNDVLSGTVLEENDQILLLVLPLLKKDMRRKREGNIAFV